MRQVSPETIARLHFVPVGAPFVVRWPHSCAGSAYAVRRLINLSRETIHQRRFAELSGGVVGDFLGIDTRRDLDSISAYVAGAQLVCIDRKGSYRDFIPVQLYRPTQPGVDTK